MIIYHTTGPELLPRVIDILAAMPKDQCEIMERSLRNSPDAWVAYADSTILGFCGLIPPTILSDTAYLWFYSTRHFASHRIACLRSSPKLITDVLRHYSIVVGHCVSGAPACRWLRWLGATFGEPQGRYIPFRIEAH